VAGWGLAEGKGRKGDHYPEILLEVDVPIRNTAKCERDYRNLSKLKKGGTSDPKSFQISKSQN
jgi:hypothetical protein